MPTSAVILGIALLALGYGVLIAVLCRRHPELHWDWDGIDARDVAFPSGFVWGTATSAHQVEGGCDRNNWARWEQAVDARGLPRIRDGQRAGRACDHWHRFREDVRLMQALGVGAYRFSIEWSKLEPEPGRLDPAAVAHYHAVLDALAEAGIRPMVTLHHFTHPLWFEDRGGFEREENLPDFVRFCERAFREYGARVEHWCTINEPAVFAVMGYALGIFPPGARVPRRAAAVLRNLLVAHLRAYRALKALPGGAQAQIGLVKNVFQLDPSRRWHLLDWALCRVLDAAYNDSVLDFLGRGVFRMVIPGRVRLVEAWPEARGATDFLGLNYYSHAHLRMRASPREPFARVPRAGDVPTDMPYASYPEGLYRALRTAARLGKPIYVTENGIADARDDRRETFIRRYLYALARARRDGVDVRGYYYWTLMDNFEWTEGYRMRFGLYAVDFATQERRLREGARALVEVVRARGA